MGKKLVYGCWMITALALGCSTPHVPDGPSCEQSKQRLVEVLGQLPEGTLSTPAKVELATSAFAGAYKKGPILEIAEPQLRLDGELLAGESRAQRAQSLAASLSQIGQQQSADTLVVAAAHDTDVRTLHDYLQAVPQQMQLRLMFNTPPLQSKQADQLQAELDLPDQVLAERDPAKRRELLARGYDEYSSCAAIDSTVASTSGLNSAERWSKLLPGMRQAVPSCACEQMQSDGLRRLLSAEQRAGSVGVGTVTAGFLRDWRCRASMPLASIQQLLDDIEEFDSEFSGNWREDALVFDQVVTDERLLVYLCKAMPGDVLASMQREGQTMYWKAADNSCQAWRFEQLARGAPMGTWRQVGGDLALHYRQAANDIRLFGPVTDPKSLPTDEQRWACDQSLHMESVDETSVTLDDHARWFFSEEACRTAPAARTDVKSCVSRLANGLPLAEPAAEAPEAGGKPAPAP